MWPDALRSTEVGRAVRLAALAVALLLTACATTRLADAEGIVDLASGERIGQDELVRRLKGADVVMLGELHDNPAHHARRGELIGALRPRVVVAEQLPAGRQVNFGPDLLASLVAAGFESRPWSWPMHEPVFAAAAAAGATVLGGNLSREQARAIATRGESAWPDELRPLLAGAPLDETARAALDDDLQRGHCGQLSAARAPAIRAAQRARDASMLLALAGAAQRPAVLVAGNGHVRLDYGVGQLHRRHHPGQRLASVGFVEVGGPLPGAREYDFAWVTPRAARSDPCAGFDAPSLR